MNDNQKINGSEITTIVFFIILYMINLPDRFIILLRELFNNPTFILFSIFSYIIGFGWAISLFIVGGYFFDTSKTRRKWWFKQYRKFAKTMFWITLFSWIFLIFTYLTSFLLPKIGILIITTFILVIILLILIKKVKKKNG